MQVESQTELAVALVVEVVVHRAVEGRHVVVLLVEDTVPQSQGAFLLEILIAESHQHDQLTAVATELRDEWRVDGGMAV